MNNNHIDELCTLFVGIRTKKEALALLQDILTKSERADVAERWQIVKMLAKGVPHRKISQNLKVSISKVTRGSAALKSDHGGFGLLLKRSKKT